MCGINGIFAFREEAPPVDEAELLRTREAMARRGPDGAGLWLAADRRVGLGHRRLAIIDLSEAGAQPMASADGRLHITFNGEIYNYRELRRELERRGYIFRTQSDTEVLLHLYADRGAAMMSALRGMFAFAIWDATERTLLLARDPFGIKPLYYASDGRTFRFASQVKALVAGGGVRQDRDPAGTAGFLLWGYVPEPFTLHRAIQALPAGCTMTVNSSGPGRPDTYFDLAREFREAEDRAVALDPETAREKLGAALAASVSRHKVADVPVGVFLSAGIDSTAIATLAARGGRGDLRCVTLGFEEHRGGPLDETPLAGETAARLGARHAVDWIGRQDFGDAIVDILAAMDQPTTDGLNTYFVARAAVRQGLKVALSGLGGDEIFLGYPSFRDVPRMTSMFAAARHLPGWLRRASRAVAAPVAAAFSSPKYAGLLEYGDTPEGAYLLRRALYMPWELGSELEPAEAREGIERLQTMPHLSATRDGVRADSSIVSVFELAWYMRGQLLRDADWAGMAHGLEIRVPFVDVDVVRAAAEAVAAGAIRNKSDFASLPSLALPRGIVERRKTGFAVPVRQWIARSARGRSGERGLRGWACQVLREQGGMRNVLVLLSEGFGGRGGIAQFNREFLRAICSDPASSAVVALPRVMPDPPEEMPASLEFVRDAVGGKIRYAGELLRVLGRRRRFGLVICAHLHLLPLAWLAAKFSRAPVLLVIHGIDAWSPTRSALTNRLAGNVHAVASVSRLSLERFRAWSRVPAGRCMILPNAIRPGQFGVGERDQALAARYGLVGKTIIMTLGRLEASERLKGIDEVIDVLPRVAASVPDIAYLVAGEGSDRKRLQEKAAALGLDGRVVFTGQVREPEKAGHYRLADAYVMPSRGEGFGIVFLEAMACGLPVVGSKVDGSREALRDGLLGRLVDPADPEELVDAIVEAIAGPKRVPDGLDHFSFENFERRCHLLLQRATLQAS